MIVTRAAVCIVGPSAMVVSLSGRHFNEPGGLTTIAVAPTIERVRPPKSRHYFVDSIAQYTNSITTMKFLSGHALIQYDSRTIKTCKSDYTSVIRIFHTVCIYEFNSKNWRCSPNVSTQWKLDLISTLMSICVALQKILQPQEQVEKKVPGGKIQ